MMRWAMNTFLKCSILIVLLFSIGKILHKLIWKKTDIDVAFKSGLNLSPHLQKYTHCENVIKTDMPTNGETTLQVLHKSNARKNQLYHKYGLYLYKAYYDDRKVLGDKRFLRITGMLHNEVIHQKDTVKCMLWFAHQNHPYSINAKAVTIWKWRNLLQGILVSCEIPPKESHLGVPSHVSLTYKHCNTPENKVFVEPKRVADMNNKTALCAKVMYASPDPLRMLEWFEVNSLFGINRVYLYGAALKGKVIDVLNYYSQTFFARLTDHSFVTKLSKTALEQPFPPYDPNELWEMELMSMNDCAYNSNERYIINIDIDEVLFPGKHRNWDEFLRNGPHRNSEKPIGSYVFHTANFVNEFGRDNSTAFPRYLHTVAYNTRTAIDWESPKSLVDTEYSLSIGHHIATHTIGPIRHRIDVLPAIEHGYLRHYRKFCRLTGAPNKCENLMAHPHKDFRIGPHRTKLVNRMYPLMKLLELV